MSKDVSNQSVTLSYLISNGHLVLRPKEEHRIDILMEEILDIRAMLKENYINIKEICLTPNQYDMLLKNFSYLNKTLTGRITSLAQSIYGLKINIINSINNGGTK